MIALRQRGLTLLEMLVALVIASLSMAMGYQSLEQWRRAQATFVLASGETSAARMNESWWRLGVSGISARFDHSMQGDELAFSSVTYNSLLSPNGSEAPHQWTLRRGGGGWLLSVSDGAQNLDFVLRGASNARFEFLDDSGDWHRQWPPSLGTKTPRPKAIALIWTDQSQRVRTWVATPRADPLPWFPAFEVEEY